MEGVDWTLLARLGLLANNTLMVAFLYLVRSRWRTETTPDEPPRVSSPPARRPVAQAAATWVVLVLVFLGVLALCAAAIAFWTGWMTRQASDRVDALVLGSLSTFWIAQMIAGERRHSMRRA